MSEFVYTASEHAFQDAAQLIPGGVDSPVRAAKAVGATPAFIAKGEGAYLWDVDGNRYIDYVGSWGPLIMGHAHPVVLEAVCEAAHKGLSFGAPTVAETELAQAITEAFPSMEMVRLVSSGTEATMSAIRLARGVTGRNYVLKFEGCYHGHADALLVKAGSGALTMGVPSSAGVPAKTTETTLVAQYNNLENVRELFQQYGNDIACVIVEPVAGNMGVVPPEEGFLQGLRDITKEYGALLICDEVMTGFRVSFGGAQGYYGIDPDLTCLGKIIGGGMPLAAFGGKREYLQYLAPEGPVYQAGTLAGNPVATAAGLATVKLLREPGVHEAIVQKTVQLAEGIREIAQRLGAPAWVNQVGAMFSVFFTETPVRDYESACSSDTDKFARYYRSLRNEGIYVAPSQFEALFMSAAHTQQDLDETLSAVEKVLKAL